MEKIKNKLLPEIIILIIVSICCLLLPNQNNYLADGWIANITGTNSSILLTIKLFLMEPLFWGVLCFFLLRCKNMRLIPHEIQPQITKKLYIIMRAVAIVLTIVLLYYTWGFIWLTVLPPMPFRLGYYIMNHRIILGISWCVISIIGYLSLKKK